MKKIVFMAALILAAIARAYANEYTDIEPQVAGCTSRNFQDARHLEQVRVRISGQNYSPRCLMVKRGTAVTIEASLMHPLQAMAPIRGRRNPFSSPFGRTFTQTRVFQQTGLYGFFCTRHGNADGEGMAGAILVVD